MQEGVYDEFVRLATERAKQRKVIVMHGKHQSHSVFQHHLNPYLYHHPNQSDHCKNQNHIVWQFANIQQCCSTPH